MSDQFDLNTQQDLKAAGDGPKLYGWHLLNASAADYIDVNITNAGDLTIDCNAINCNFMDINPPSTPMVYKEVSGDFDIETSFTSFAGDQNYEQQGFFARDTTASAGEDWVMLMLRYQGGNGPIGTYWANKVNNNLINSSNNITQSNYFRIKRVGSSFTMYSKVNSGDAWSSHATFTRSDFATTIHVGLFAGPQNTANNYVARFGYFQGTYTGLVDGSASLTLPLIELHSGVWAAQAVLPALRIASAYGVQEGNFLSLAMSVITLETSGFAGNRCDVNETLRLISCEGTTPPQSDIECSLPVITFDGRASVSNPLIGQCVVPRFKTGSSVTVGTTSTWSIKLKAPEISSLMGAVSDVTLPLAATSAAQWLTGRMAKSGLKLGLPDLDGASVQSVASTVSMQVLRMRLSDSLVIVGNPMTCVMSLKLRNASRCMTGGVVVTEQVNLPKWRVLVSSHEEIAGAAQSVSPGFTVQGFSRRDFHI